jgi:hypothetical protein
VPQRHSDSILQLPRAPGLLDIVHSPQSHALALRSRVDLGRQDYHRDRAGVGVLLELGQDLETIHHRHHQVQQDKVRLFRLSFAIPAQSVLGYDHLVASLLQNRAYDVSDIGLIVNHENLGHAGGSSPRNLKLRIYLPYHFSGTEY